MPTLFVYDDGHGYALHVSENFMTLYVSKLSPDFADFLRPEQLGVTWNRIIINQGREVPASFKYDGHYYLFSSGCTFWIPNPSLLGCAPHPLGPWENLGDPFTGPGAVSSHHSQPTSVFAMPGAPDGSFVSGADGYRVYADGLAVAFTDLPSVELPSLLPGVDLTYRASRGAREWPVARFQCRAAAFRQTASLPFERPRAGACFHWLW